MSVASTTIDPSRRLDFYFRVKRDGTKKFIFLDADGGAIDISAYDFALYIKEYAGARTNIIAFTIGTGLEISGAGFNELTATFTVANTNVKEGQYYVELVKLSTNKTYLNGYAIAHNGVFDGVTVNTNDVTITDGADTVTIQITESGGVGSSILTGAQIEAALGYTPATSDDISTYVDQALTDFIEGQEGFPNSDQITDSIIADVDAMQRWAQAIIPYLPAPPEPPAISGVPTISGTLTVPNTLTATPASVVGSGVTNTFQWERDGVAISGATGITYDLVDPDDFSVDITVVQTARASNGLTDTAESAASSIGAAADTTPPTISASITNITARSADVNITTDEIATHYYIGVLAGSTMPTKAQIKAGVNYGAVTIVAAGNALGTSTNQNTTVASVTTLEPETPYDFHKMAEDPAGNQSDIDSDTNVTTLAEAAQVYELAPSPPPFTDAVTLVAATVGSTVEASDLNGKREILLPNPYDQRFRVNGVIGTAPLPYRVKSVSDSVRSWITPTLAAGQQAIVMMNGSNHWNFYFLGIKGNSDPTQTGISGVTLTAYAGAGAFNEFVDIRIKDMSFAGFHVNNAVAGAVYNLTIKHIAVHGHSTEGEGLYLGPTGTQQESRFINTIIEHAIITSKGRDGIQLNNHFNFHLKKGTTYLVGQGTAAGISIDQKSHLQIQNCTGLAENGVSWGAPRAWNIFAHGVTIRNWTFYVTSANRAYIGKASLNYPGSLQLTGEPLIFDSCHFGSSVPVDYFTNIAEDGIDISFINCTKDSNVAQIYFDNRADKATKTLSHIGTTTAASVTPVFAAIDIEDEVNHGHITTQSYLDKGQGWHVKDPVVAVEVPPTVQASSLVASNVTDTSMTLTWTTSDGDVDLLLGKAGSAVDSLPVDDTNYAASNAFGSGSELGTGNFVVHKDSTNTVNITGLTPSTTYHWRVCAGNGSLANVKFLTTTATLNPISQATNAPAAFQPSDIAWDTFLDYSTAEADLAGGIWQNQGLDGDAIVALNSPTWDASKQMVRHVKTSNQRFTIQAANNYATPVTYLDVINTPTVFTGTQTLCGLSNTHKISYNSAGLLSISGVSTGITLAVDTRYKVGVKFQGASSSYFIDAGAETAITLSTNAIGTPNWRSGSAFNNVDHFDGWRKYTFVKRGLTAQELSDMRDWLNNL